MHSRVALAQAGQQEAAPAELLHQAGREPRGEARPEPRAHGPDIHGGVCPRSQQRRRRGDRRNQQQCQPPAARRGRPAAGGRQRARSATSPGPPSSSAVRISAASDGPMPPMRRCQWRCPVDRAAIHRARRLRTAATRRTTTTRSSGRRRRWPGGRAATASRPASPGSSASPWSVNGPAAARWAAAGRCAPARRHGVIDAGAARRCRSSTHTRPPAGRRTRRPSPRPGRGPRAAA